MKGKRQHGVGLYMHNRVTSGEFEIQPVNERIIWVDQAVFSVYAPTNKKDNVAEVDKFYSTLEKQVNEVRTKYGPETKIIILGDFNAGVGTDGADNMTEERNEADEVCANGTFGFEETDDNGAELITFCVTKQFKVMDSYFAGEYGTWACNRSIDKGYHAALDHILVSKEFWGEVAACGVHIPTFRWNTDHRMVELDMGPCGEKASADTEAGRRQGEDESEQAKERAVRRNFNKHVLWCRLQLDPDQELPRMREALERLVAKAKMAMLDNLESDPEWEQHTRINC
jgi:exonuclease III